MKFVMKSIEKLSKLTGHQTVPISIKPIQSYNPSENHRKKNTK